MIQRSDIFLHKCVLFDHIHVSKLNSNWIFLEFNDLPKYIWIHFLYLTLFSTHIDSITVNLLFFTLIFTSIKHCEDNSTLPWKLRLSILKSLHYCSYISGHSFNKKFKRESGVNMYLAKHGVKRIPAYNMYYFTLR